MKKVCLILSILIVNLSLFAQFPNERYPNGRYFDSIQGSIWQSMEHIEKGAFSDLKKFGLAIIEIEVDSLKSNSTIWSFNQLLKIETYDAKKKERDLILECKYIHDYEDRSLKLLIDNQEIEFTYVSVSTGAYIGFTRRKE